MAAHTQVHVFAECLVEERHVFPIPLPLSGVKLLIHVWAELEPARLNLFIFSWRNSGNDGETSGESRGFPQSVNSKNVFFSSKALREDFRFFRDCPRLTG